MMEVKNPENPKDYLSTRQSARQLQVSLGTVQKMVETGELLAWKTRGGHRRILCSSLEKLLKRRRMGIRERSSEQFLVLAVLKQPEQAEKFKKFSEAWKSDPEIYLCTDTLEALMQAVSLSPDIIYIDPQLPPVEQVHLLHYLNKHVHTKNIPVLVEAEFIRKNPQVQKMPSNRGKDLKTEKNSNMPRKMINNPMIKSYKKQDLIQEDGGVNQFYAEKMEQLIFECLAKKYEGA
jgi:excisionase family DNA binding protein